MPLPMNMSLNGVEADKSIVPCNETDTNPRGSGFDVGGGEHVPTKKKPTPKTSENSAMDICGVAQ